MAALPPDELAPLFALWQAQDFAGVLAAATPVPEGHPFAVQLHNLAGSACIVLGRLEQAVEHLSAAQALAPHFTEIGFNLALALEKLGRLPEAIEAYGRELAIQPGHATARAHRLHQRGMVCDWSAEDEFVQVADTLGIAESAVPPFVALALDDDPARHRARAERWAQATFGTIEPALPLPDPPPAADGRLRIGYFSSDFHDHATMHLLAGVLRHHDRRRFAVHAFSYGEKQEDSHRAALESHVEHVHDVHGADDAAIVARARAAALDLAVDLKGYTGGTRSALFARRLAPVQAAWLGFPGTMGAPFIDYLVADAHVVPPGERAHYAERLILLPDSYQPNDDRRPIASDPADRAAAGLPGSGFVFACLNDSYKIRSATFALWMRLLARVDGSVLWLLATNRWAMAALREAAEAHGIDPARVIFAPHLPHARHLARLAHADLFLDTFPCNAHTTASDALWAGLPVLTRSGRSFSARVAASLLHAVGLPECVTGSDAAYEARALTLARDPAHLAALRAQLARQRRTAPLFDTARFTRHLEAGWLAAVQRHRAGLPPADLPVSAQDAAPIPPVPPRPAFRISFASKR